MEGDKPAEENGYDASKFDRKYGSRSEVFDLGTAYCTRGGLKKSDLTLSKTGRIVSVKKQTSARENYKQYGFKKRAPKEEPEKAPEKKKRRRRKKKVKNDM